MMRLSGKLRRFRWLVLTAWLLALVPSIYLALSNSGNLTGGGFEVAGSQSLHVQYQLEDHFQRGRIRWRWWPRPAPTPPTRT